MKIIPKELAFKPLPQDVKDYMYFKKGSWWIYKVNERYHNRIDTIDLYASYLDTVQVNGTFWHYAYESLSVIYSTRNTINAIGGLKYRPNYSYLLDPNGGDYESAPTYKIWFQTYYDKPNGYEGNSFFYPMDNTVVGDQSDVRFVSKISMTNHFGIQSNDVAIFSNSNEERVGVDPCDNCRTRKYWAPHIGIIRWVSEDSVFSHELMEYHIVQ